MKLSLVLVVTIAGACLAPAESVHSSLREPARFKISDGLLLHWNVTPDRNRDAIEAFDQNGVRLFGIDVYQLMPSAGKIGISDVAARRDGSIAIASVTAEKDRIRPWLMQLDTNGRLRKLTELDSATEIGWLAFDRRGNVWALTDYLGERVRKDTIYNGTPCPLGPMILVFNSDGKIVGSLFKQIDFRPGMQQGPKIGDVSFGLTDDKVWFWQPAKHRMIIAGQNGGDVRKISIPHAPTYNLGGQTLLTPSGEVVQDLYSPTPGVGGIYLASGRRIEKISPPPNTFLAGMDGSEFVFVRFGNKIGDFSVIRVTSLKAELSKAQY